MRTPPPRENLLPLIGQGAGILLVSVLLGLAFNVLNPAGLSWREPSTAEEGVSPSTPPGAGIYRVETVSARLVHPGAAGKRMSLSPALPRPPAEPPPGRAPGRTTWEKSRALIEGGAAVLVDSRSRLAFEAGHIPGAVNLPEKELESAIGDFLATHLPPDTALVIYCGNAKCASSAKLASALHKDYGYDHVQYVPGGYLEWRRNQNTLQPQTRK